MPLTGGPSDKFGNRYEGLWTIFQLIRVLDGEVHTLRLEDPSPEGEGVEFWIDEAGIRRYHQVKRQISVPEKWTISQLQHKGVLGHFWRKLQGTINRCVFVSMDDASELRELGERAQGAVSYSEYQQHFLSTNGYEKAFRAVVAAWGNCSREEAFFALKRIEVYLEAEKILLHHVEALLATRFDAEPATVRGIIGDFIQDQVHHSITAHTLLHHLATVHHIHPWAISPRHPVALAIQDATVRYLTSQINEQLEPVIPRRETNTILEHLQHDTNMRCILVHGPAGVGKSGVQAACIAAIQALAWPVLALRVDRLPDASSPQAIGSSLYQRHLSPVHVLAVVAQEMPCLLVIDQLDAISLASGRRAEMFDVIREIIDQAEQFPQMRVLLSARSFDLANDYRLRSLTQKHHGASLTTTLEVEILDPEEVTTRLAQWSISSQHITERQRLLLRTPLHLKLFSELVQDHPSSLPFFTTVNDLYRLFCRRKEQEIRTKAERVIQFWPAIDTLSAAMSKGQQLIAPESILDTYSADAQALTSAHIFIHDEHQRSYAFFHEGFFDYAFARRFAQTDQSLVALLLSDEQHLFRRTQVRQILALERESNHSRYLSDLHAVLTHPGIRFHLRQIALAFLGDLIEPDIEEWQILAPLVRGSNLPLRQEILTMLGGGIAWFNLLDEQSVWANWLSQPETVAASLAIFRGLLNRVSDRIADLLTPYLSDPTWLPRITNVVVYADFAISRKLFDLFLALIDAGGFDQYEEYIAHGNDFWLLLYTLPNQQPVWTCEAIGHFLRRRRQISVAAGNRNPFGATPGLADSAQSHGVLLAAASGASHAFIEQMLALLLEVMQANAIPGTGRLVDDDIWRYFTIQSAWNLPSELLESMQIALSLVAKDRERFTPIAAQLASSLFVTAQYLLMRTYIAKPQQYGEAAVAYVKQMPEALTISYMEMHGGVAYELIRAISPYCSAQSMAMIEHVILNEHPDTLPISHKRRQLQSSQWGLLTAIPAPQRSPQAKRAVIAGRRRFQRDEPRLPPRRSWHPGDSLVRSPLSPEDTEHFTDQQWHDALAYYRHEDLSWNDQGLPIGGASQVAQQLEESTRGNPSRFAQLMVTLPDVTPPVYCDAVLRGISGSALAISELEDVVGRCHSLPQRPCGKEICRCIGSFAARPLPDSVIATAVWYATSDLDPSTELWRMTPTPDGSPYFGGSIDMAGINSTRGAAAEVIGTLLSSDSDRLPLLLPAIVALVRDPILAVRASTLQALRSLAVIDREQATDLLKQICADNDAVLHSQFFHRLLRPLLFTHFLTLAPLLDRLINADQEATVTAGAEIASLVSLSLPEAATRAEYCLHGSTIQRRGVAHVYAANILTHGNQFCDAFIPLFADDDTQIREEAAACFHTLQGDDLLHVKPFVDAFVASPALLSHPFHLFYALEQTTTPVPDIICQACERLLSLVEEASERSARERYAGIADTLITLILRVYTQTTTNAVKSRCLDMIDRIAQQGYPKIAPRLNQFER